MASGSPITDGQEDLVSIVIPVFNAAATLGPQLDALARQTWLGRSEFIISDNGSTDATREVIASFAGRLDIRVVDSSDRKGAGHARNVGTAVAAGSLIAYCDADDVVHPGWLAGLVEVAEGADLVGGALEHDLLNEPHTEWRGRDGADSLPRPLDFLPFAISANCAVRRRVWQAIGGWKEDYEHGGDDVDFSWRVQLAGFRLAFAPGAIVHYRRRSTLNGLAHQVYDYAQADVRLYRDYRASGARRPPLRSTFRTFRYLVTRLPYLAMAERRKGMWVVVAATVGGHLVGSWNNRTLYL